jgi:SAM-dependent methyltransferase
VTESLDGDVRAYYDRGAERERLTQGVGLLEFARTCELIARHLPAGALDVLDVGGGPGPYAQWLCGLGHRLIVIDPIPLHVEQARQADPAITAKLGDARNIPADDDSADVVLLLGPLYHLVAANDRAKALAQAVRCLRPGGVLIAAVISRYAALLDLLIRHDRIHEEGVFEAASNAIRTGVFEGTTRDLFTTAYFHLPEEILDETAGAGLTGGRLFNIEGPGAFASHVAERWTDDPRRQALLDAARLVEEDPHLLAAASHLLVIAHKPA